MYMIAAVDSNWALGKDNKLLVSIPEDMKFFRETTAGHVVVMGRKTLESFPGKKPLKNRTNIVLTSDTNYVVDGADVVNTVDELIAKLEVYERSDIYVIGGGSVYRQLLPYADTCLITKIYKEFDADTYFPDLDADEEWSLTAATEKKTHEGLEFAFCTYTRK